MKMQQMYNEYAKVNNHFYIFLSLGNVTSSIHTVLASVSAQNTILYLCIREIITRITYSLIIVPHFYIIIKGFRMKTK